ncbi:hypothetical protein BX666DRAFT_303511 [Dichotomocladium elegans]|nr:hypothetical protein BX666DRAFT_303511 [Dichotomocladium elegans]
MSEIIGVALPPRVYWAAWALLPVAMTVFYRLRGGYYYRSTVFLLAVALCGVYGVVASLILPMIGKTHLINWSVSHLFYHLAGFLTGVKVTAEGLEHIDSKRPTVYVCNHQASIDVLVMGSVFPKATSMVAKKSLKYYPFLGWYMTLSKAIFLDRKNHDSAIKQARKAAQDIHNNKTSVFLFPEGTRSHPKKIDMLPFKKGAFYMAVQANVPIVPVVVANYNNLYDSREKRFIPGTIKLKVLPPVDTADIKEDSASIDVLTNKVRDQMLVALKEISSIAPPPVESKKVQ